MNPEQFEKLLSNLTGKLRLCEELIFERGNEPNIIAAKVRTMASISQLNRDYYKKY